MLPEVIDHLELEDAGFNTRDVRYSSYFTVDDSVGFVVFDYTYDESPYGRGEGPPFAFVQNSLVRGVRGLKLYRKLATHGRPDAFLVHRRVFSNESD
jgi:hypothetical protein